MPRWSATQIPDQTGRNVLITGANSGLGRYSAATLASRGARVLLACRSAERGQQAVDEIRDAGGEAELVELDLADLSSVRQAASTARALCPGGIDILMNNAGVMAPPLSRTQDGFELQMGVNHLGHAALTWLLMPSLMRPGARVVTLSSIAHRAGAIDLSDLNYEYRKYNAGRAYGQSKLANLLFAFELDRRARAAGLDLLSVAAHPGVTATDLGGNMARARGSSWMEKGWGLLNRVVNQPVADGAAPQLYAATMPDVRSGDYYGPDGPGEARGGPKKVSSTAAAQDTRVAAELWDLTATLTGVTPDPR
ncbi:oxidoreductase [Actinoalloteichus spitiensis]|uniref:oxidoreductase n=1 Tax=Actinoalloteichus spitiensis TaxID=252394 RepID=UPI00037DDBD1|nr:oxidoreductase [Actinoalloteichus spitiensis]